MAPRSTPVVVRVGGALIHIDDVTEVGAVLEQTNAWQQARLRHPNDVADCASVATLAAASEMLMQAAAAASPADRIRSLRDVTFLCRSKLGQDYKFVQQLQAAYSLLRHLPRPDLLARVHRISANLRATDDHERAANHPWSPADLMDDRRLRLRTIPPRGNATGPNWDGQGGSDPHGDKASETNHSSGRGFEQEMRTFLQEQVDRLDLRRGQAALAQCKRIGELESRLEQLEPRGPPLEELEVFQDAPVPHREARRRVHFAGEHDPAAAQNDDHEARLKKIELMMGRVGLDDILKAVRANADLFSKVESMVCELQARQDIAEAQARALERVNTEIHASLDGLRQALDTFAEATSEELNAVQDELSSLKFTEGQAHLPTESLKSDGRRFDHECPVTFPHLEAQDIMEVRQCSRRSWRAVLHSFEPPPVAVVQAPCELSAAEPDGLSELGPRTAREGEKTKPPRYGKIGYGSGLDHAKWRW